MLLEKNPSARPRGILTRPAPSAFGASHDYPLTDWTQPSQGRAVVDGLGGIGRAMGAALLAIAALIGAAMVVAVLLASVVQAFGVDLSVHY